MSTLTNTMVTEIAKAIINDTRTVFNNANAHIGVGDGTAAFSTSQNDLDGINVFRETMASGYPTRAGNVLRFRSVFGTADANFAWNEVGIFNVDIGTLGVMATRLVYSFGTKTSSESWQVTIKVTVTAP